MEIRQWKPTLFLIFDIYTHYSAHPSISSLSWKLLFKYFITKDGGSGIKDYDFFIILENWRNNSNYNNFFRKDNLGKEEWIFFLFFSWGRISYNDINIFAKLMAMSIRESIDVIEFASLKGLLKAINAWKINYLLR